MILQNVALKTHLCYKYSTRNQRPYGILVQNKGRNTETLIQYCSNLRKRFYTLSFYKTKSNRLFFLFNEC